MSEQNIEQSLWGQSNNLGGLADAPIHAVRQDVEGQMGGLIDHLAGQVPGGHTFAPEAKRALAGVLDGLQSQLENQVQSRLGGSGGGNQGNQGNQGSSSTGDSLL